MRTIGLGLGRPGPFIRKSAARVKRLEDGLRAEHQISGVLDLHKAPVVGRSEDVGHRTALLGIAIEDAMQLCGRELIGQGLRLLPVVDADKGVVGKREADPGGGRVFEPASYARCNRTADGMDTRWERANRSNPLRRR